MDANVTLPGRKLIPQTRYCALEYSSPECGSITANPANIILLLLAPAEGSASVLLHPRWREIVRPADRAYIEEIFRDFTQRIGDDPNSLFTQASQLGMGILITHATGVATSEDPALLGDLLQRFTVS